MLQKLIRRYISVKASDKIIFFLFITTIINIGSFIFKFVMGLVIPSIWFLINSLFYLVAIFARGVSVRSYQKVKLLNDNELKNKMEYKNYYSNGIILIFMGITYFGVSLYMILHPTINDIKGYMVYAVAFQAFLSLGVSIYGMIKYKRDKSPIMSSVKCTNFCNSLTSIVLTQVVLLDNFGGNIKYEKLNGVTGVVISLIIIIVGIWMAYSVKNIKRKGGFKDGKSINSWWWREYENSFRC